MEDHVDDSQCLRRWTLIDELPGLILTLNPGLNLSTKLHHLPLH